MFLASSLLLITMIHTKVLLIPYRIVFHFATQVQPCDAPIPLYCFNFVDFFVISIEDKPDQQLIDVIGAMTTCGEIRSYQYYGIAGQILDFTLENEIGDTLKCSIFGARAKEIYDYVTQHEGPIITIIELTRMKKYRDEMQINSSWNATKVMLNLDIPEVVNFTKRPLVKLCSTNSSTTQLDGSVSVSLVNSLGPEYKKNIKDILNITVAGKYVVTATITGINLNSNWYYDSCNACRKKTEVRSRVPFCASCKKTPGLLIARYMTHINVEDGSGEAVFVFFDEIGFKLVKRTAYDLRKQQVEAGEKYGFPKELDELVGRKLCFCIEASEFYNLTKKSKTYTIFEVGETIDQQKQDLVTPNSEKTVQCTNKEVYHLTNSADESGNLSYLNSPPLAQPSSNKENVVSVCPDISTALSLKKGKRKAYTDDMKSISCVQVNLTDALDNAVEETMTLSILSSIL